MPDYKALIYESSLFPFNRSQLNSYKKDSPTTKLIDNAINAECYNANQEGNLQRISIDSDILKEIEKMDPAVLAKKYFKQSESKNKLDEKDLVQLQQLQKELDAKKAKDLGIINELIAYDELDTYVKRLKLKFQSLPPIAIKYMKKQMNKYIYSVPSYQLMYPLLLVQSSCPSP